MAGAVQPCTCQDLLAEEAKLKRLRADGAAAAAAYKPPGDPDGVPPGYTEATPEQLREMNLNPAMLEHPRDGNGKPTDFRARVFVNSTTGERIVAFKGTESGADWGQNLRQGAGMDSFYYKQAQRIGGSIAASPQAANTHFTGHSLGGGLATAASRNSGLPAATFNAASLNKGTVPQPNTNGRIDAVNVRGDPLTAANEGLIGTTPGTEVYKLDPPDYLGQDVAKKYPWYDLKNRAIAFKNRQLALHGMGTANDAMAKRAGQVDQAIKDNKCR
ncbi:hypothetical protein [Sphingomonas sp.]|uniref:hypothetical protein n=1 Tax=Sphingomonas sp. TaxID=28214 RepID=UPI003CC58458